MSQPVFFAFSAELLVLIVIIEENFECLTLTMHDFYFHRLLSLLLNHARSIHSHICLRKPLEVWYVVLHKGICGMSCMDAKMFDVGTFCHLRVPSLVGGCIWGCFP